MNSYAIGNSVRVSVTFSNGVSAVDPTVVRGQVCPPSGVVATYTYGTDAAVKKIGTGLYYMDIDVNAEGLWRYRFAGTESNQAAAESAFDVPASVFA